MIKILLCVATFWCGSFSATAQGALLDHIEGEDDFVIQAIRLGADERIYFRTEDELALRTRLLFRSFQDVSETPEDIHNFHHFLKSRTSTFLRALAEWSAAVANAVPGFSVKTKLELHRAYTRAVLREMFEALKFKSEVAQREFFADLHGAMQPIYSDATAQLKEAQKKMSETAGKTAMVQDLIATALAMIVSGGKTVNHIATFPRLAAGAFVASVVGANMFWLLATIGPSIPREIEMSQESRRRLAEALEAEIELMMAGSACELDLDSSRS